MSSQVEHTDVGAYALGLWLSVPFDLPAGPFIVTALAALALCVAAARRALG